jgi:inorganic pyrophosphatase/exopolyphosphatase
MVSAILYGLLASARRAPGEVLVVPVINCPRRDFALRTEAVYLFAALGVDVDALLFIDEIDLESLHQAGRLRLTLVDHDIFSADQEKYADVVDAVIDHHPDGGLYRQAMFFEQGNTSISRKKLQPGLHRFFSDQSSG